MPQNPREFQIRGSDHDGGGFSGPRAQSRFGAARRFDGSDDEGLANFFGNAIGFAHPPPPNEDPMQLHPTQATPPPTFSERLWALDWSDRLPWQLDDEIRLEVASMDTLVAFVRESYRDIFASDPKDDRFLPDPMTAAKWRFLEASDRFVFLEGRRAVGVLLGQPVDWSTYYWRSAAFLPEFQGRGLLAAALERTDAVMREIGIERVEGETAPINYRQVRLLHRLGYCVTGSTNSERWGTMLRLTKFLAPQGRDKFTSRFCRDSFSASREMERRLDEERRTS